MASRRITRESKKDFVNDVVDSLIERLKEGTAPWQRPWNPDLSSGLPINGTTGDRYRGINSIMLSCQVRSDPRWMTFLQAKEQDWHVKKGETGTQIQYWKTHETRVLRDDKGNPVLDDKGKKKKVHVQLERPRVFYSTVFNAEQIEGIPPVEKKEIEWNPIEKAETILKNSGVKIENSNNDRAYYSPLQDTIKLPKREQFDDAGKFYGTALHELGHWTGHESRLDRNILNPFGSTEYAKEELRAEIASMILGQELQIGRDPGQHDAYVQSWISVLKEDPLELFRAATDAEQICTLIRSYENEQVLKEQQEIQEEAQQVVMDDITIENNEPLSNEKPEVTPDQEYFVVKGRLQGEWSSDAVAILDGGNLDRIIQKNGFSLHNELMKFPDSKSAFAALDKATNETEVVAGDRLILDVLLVNVNGQLTTIEPSLSVAVSPPEKILIDVPFKEKNEAKQLGAKWDKAEKSWYYTDPEQAKSFERWAKSNVDDKPTNDLKSSAEIEVEKRRYLAVPYGERLAAKSAGAKWDKGEKSWYVDQQKYDENSSSFSRWSNLENDDTPAMDPREEFKQALIDMGCDVQSTNDGTEHPIMDGTKKRIALIDDKGTERGGFYVGYLDGHPAGYIKNHRTGATMNWKSKGYSLSNEEKAKLNELAVTKKKERLEGDLRNQIAAAERVTADLKNLKQIVEPTPYLKSKGLEVHKGAFTDDKNKTTFIPVYDIDGKLWSMAYLREDGTKRFAKEAKKEGCFHAVGNGFSSLKDAPVLVLSEGYSTAGTLSQALGFTTVAVFDSGNLPVVAKQFRDKYPEKPMLICGDDDLAVKERLGNNPGRNKAEEAARAVGGTAIFPIFAPGEQSKENKDFTDFNDLAQKSVLGKDGVKNQVQTIVKLMMERQRSIAAEQKQEKTLTAGLRR